MKTNINNKKKMKNILLLIIAILIICPMIIAEQQSLGIFKKGECVNILQSCSNCSYTNISNIISPDSTRALGEVTMQKIGLIYNYSFCNTTSLGDYIVNGFSDVDGTITNWAYDFNINYTGEKINGLDSLGIILACIVIAGLLFYVSTLFAKEQKGVKTLLIMFGIVFILLTMQIAKSSIPGLEKVMNSGLIMGLVLLMFMLAYFMILYTKEIFIKLRNSWKEKKAASFGETIQ